MIDMSRDVSQVLTHGGRQVCVTESHTSVQTNYIVTRERTCDDAIAVRYELILLWMYPRYDA